MWTSTRSCQEHQKSSVTHQQDAGVRSYSTVWPMVPYGLLFTSEPELNGIVLSAIKIYCQQRCATLHYGSPMTGHGMTINHRPWNKILSLFRSKMEYHIILELHFIMVSLCFITEIKRTKKMLLNKFQQSIVKCTVQGYESVCEKKSEIIWNAWKDVLFNALKVWKWGIVKSKKVWNQIKIWTLTSLTVKMGMPLVLHLWFVSVVERLEGQRR